MSGFCSVCDQFLKLEYRKEPRKPVALYPVQHLARGEDTGGRECPGVRRAV